MLFSRSYAPRDSDARVKVVKRPRSGVQRFSERAYRGFRVEVWRRRLGVSVHRVVYSVSILDPEGEHAGYFSGFSATEPARQAAQAWIDRRLLQTTWGRHWPQSASSRAGRRTTGTRAASGEV